MRRSNGASHACSLIALMPARGGTDALQWVSTDATTDGQARNVSMRKFACGISWVECGAVR